MRALQSYLCIPNDYKDAKLAVLNKDGKGIMCACGGNYWVRVVLDAFHEVQFFQPLGRDAGCNSGRGVSEAVSAATAGVDGTLLVIGRSAEGKPGNPSPRELRLVLTPSSVLGWAASLALDMSLSLCRALSAPPLAVVSRGAEASGAPPRLR